jgi:hypothetical protein
MNFHSLVLEELEIPYEVIRDANENELKILNKQMGNYLQKPLDTGWLMRLGDKNNLVTPNYTENNPNWDFIIFTSKGYFSSYASPSSKTISKRSGNSTLIRKAIEKWNLIKQLSPDTLSTFKGLIDEL